MNDSTKPFNYFGGTLPDHFRVRTGDVLLSWSGTPGTSFGCFRWKGQEGWLNQHIFNVKVNSVRITPEYFVYHVNAVLDEMIRKAHGGVGLRHITKRQLSGILLLVPSLEEQHRIVDLLSRAENIVLMRREAEAKVKEAIPALFLDMFGDPGRNPKGWEVKRIGDLCSYSRYGPRFPDREYSQGGAHILRTTDMDAFGTIRWWEAPTLPMDEAELDKYQLRAPVLLITRSGTIGRTALYKGSDVPCIAGAYLIEVGLKEGVCPEYVLHFLLSDVGQTALIRGARGITQANLNAPTIMGIAVPLPPLALQQGFASRVAQLRALSDLQAKAASVTTGSFESMLAGAFGA